MNDAYRPPGAPVADPQPTPVKLGRRPASISLASLLIVMAIIGESLQLYRFTSGFGAITGAVWVVVMVGVALMVERGRNWARWLLLVAAAWDLLVLALEVLAAGVPAGAVPWIDYQFLALKVGASLCLVAATTFVFGPGRAWFARRDS